MGRWYNGTGFVGRRWGWGGGGWYNPAPVVVESRPIIVPQQAVAPATLTPASTEMSPYAIAAIAGGGVLLLVIVILLVVMMARRK